MNLWIRSQDKMELRPNPKLAIEVIQGRYYVTDRYEFDKSNILGIYETEKRALEVLDEIQSAIEHKGDCYYKKEEDALCNIYGVYEMPKNKR